MSMDTLKKSIILTPFNVLYKFSPESTLKILFRIKLGYSLNLKNPKTYNEKLQWIKLYDRNPLMPMCCDKFTVRQYIEERGCKELLNILIWQGFNPDEIPFDELPDKFVLKITHGSTFNIICKDKSKLNPKTVIEKCHKWLKVKFLPCYGEWFYGIEPPRIIIEKYIESADDEQLRDYKVFCFNGEPKMIRIDTDRFTHHKMDFYDCCWNKIYDAGMGFDISGRDFQKPDCLDALLNYAKKLSRPFLHARIDFYIVKSKIIFGEITFTNGAGFDKCSSYDFDLRMGNWIDLHLL